jgi:hypothetical protein
VLTLHRHPPARTKFLAAAAPVPQLDISSHTPDKSLMATVPQLSTHSLLAVAPSLPSGRLYALLGNSQVHVWAAGARGQGAQLLEVWASLVGGAGQAR